MKKRSKRKISFIVVPFLCLIAIISTAQKPVFKKHGILPEKSEWRDRVLPIQAVQYTDFQSNTSPYQNALLSNPGLINPVQMLLPADFYVQNFGFFCKNEWKFEKTVHIPLRFRLGSLEYCNYLEGKK